MGWTEERVEALKALWNDGLSASQIAAELGGVTRNSVIGKINRLGLTGRKKQPSRKPAASHPWAQGKRKPPSDREASAMKERLIGFRKAGLTGNEIARALGCSRGHVVRLMNEHGLQGKARGRNGKNEPRHDVKVTTALRHPQRTAREVPTGQREAAQATPPTQRDPHASKNLGMHGPCAERRREGLSHGARDAVDALQPGQCRWPEGDPRRPDFRFCGAEAMSGSSYCRHHRWHHGKGNPGAYIRGTSQQDRRKARTA